VASRATILAARVHTAFRHQLPGKTFFFGEAAFNYSALSTNVFLKKNTFFFYHFFIKRDGFFDFYHLCNTEFEGIEAKAERLLTG